MKKITFTKDFFDFLEKDNQSSRKLINKKKHSIDVLKTIENLQLIVKNFNLEESKTNLLIEFLASIKNVYDKKSLEDLSLRDTTLIKADIKGELCLILDLLKDQNIAQRQKLAALDYLCLENLPDMCAIAIESAVTKSLLILKPSWATLFKEALETIIDKAIIDFIGKYEGGSDGGKQIHEVNFLFNKVAKAFGLMPRKTNNYEIPGVRAKSFDYIPFVDGKFKVYENEDIREIILEKVASKLMVSELVKNLALLMENKIDIDAACNKLDKACDSAAKQLNILSKEENLIFSLYNIYDDQGKKKKENIQGELRYTILQRLKNCKYIECKELTIKPEKLLANVEITWVDSSLCLILLPFSRHTEDKQRI